MLPSRIVMTEGDCKEINEKGTLRGRPLKKGISTIWQEEYKVWEGIQVFTGKKRDVIRWFLDSRRRVVGRGGFRSTVYMRSFQYDMLVSQLLRSGDIDVIRAVLRGAYRTGQYSVPEWTALLQDKRLSTTERISAWQRVAELSAQSSGEKVEKFWEFFDEEITTDDIVELTMRSNFCWEVFAHVGNSKRKVSREEACRLLYPILRREYLGVCDGALVEKALRALRQVNNGKESKVAEHALSKLISWDKAGDVRSPVMWSGLSTLSEVDGETAKKLKALMATAKVPENAGRAFHAYARTPLGAKELAEKGWRSYFTTYLQVAFGKKTREEQYYYLRALSGYRRVKDGRAEFVEFDELPSALRKGKVSLVVNDAQKKLLEKAWEHTPEALKHVAVGKSR